MTVGMAMATTARTPITFTAIWRPLEVTACVVLRVVLSVVLRLVRGAVLRVVAVRFARSGFKDRLVLAVTYGWPRRSR